MLPQSDEELLTLLRCSKADLASLRDYPDRADRMTRLAVSAALLDGLRAHGLLTEETFAFVDRMGRDECDRFDKLHPTSLQQELDGVTDPQKIREITQRWSED